MSEAAEYEYRRWPNEALVAWFSTLVGRLAVPQRQSLRILEVGCGGGNNLRLFCEMGCYWTTGIDINLTALSRAQRLLTEDGTSALLLERDVRDLRMVPDYYDLVVDVTCLQHLTEADHHVALQQIHAVLKPGGKLFSYRLVHGTHYRALFPTEPPVWLATCCELRDQCAAVGFSATGLLHRKREYPGGLWANYVELEAIK